MKNIFKFMGIALVACSLMVACGKDDPEENNDTTPDTPTSVAKVNFNGTEWNATDILVDFSYADQYGIYSWQILNGNTADDPFTFGYTGTQAGRTYELDGQSQGVESLYYFMYVENDDDYFEATNSQGQVQDYPRKQPYTTVSNLIAFDVTAKTTSLTVNAQLYDYPTYDQTGQLELLPMTVTLTDATWAESAK